MGSRRATALSRPALPPCASSSLKRMVPPPLPPVLDILSYVPEECHARRTIVGPKSPSRFMSVTTSPRSAAKRASGVAAPDAPAAAPERRLLSARAMSARRKRGASAAAASAPRRETRAHASGDRSRFASANFAETTRAGERRARAGRREDADERAFRVKDDANMETDRGVLRRADRRGRV